MKGKELESLTLKEFNRLKENGMLAIIYPDIPKDYKHKEIPPTPVPLLDIDFTKVVEQAKSIIKRVEDGEYHEDNDDAQYMYEAVMTAIYGKKIWDWFNHHE